MVTITVDGDALEIQMLGWHKLWSVRNPENALVIQCSSEAAYNEVIVEVEDPDETLARIQAVLPKRA